MRMPGANTVTVLALVASLAAAMAALAVQVSDESAPPRSAVLARHAPPTEHPPTPAATTAPAPAPATRSSEPNADQPLMATGVDLKGKPVRFPADDTPE